MKKFLSVIVALLATATAFAQQPKVGTFTIQPKVGLAVAGSSLDYTKSKVGLVTGAEFGYQICEPFAITAGVNYAEYGFRTYNLGYIAIPMLANYYVCPGLALKAGFEPAFNVKAEPAFNVKAEEEYESYGCKATGDLYGAKSVILSIPVGVSYEYKQFIFDARYNIGVTDFADDVDGTLSQFVITFGYKFRLD